MRRLLLFDIDGTLVAGGPAKDAFHTALVETFDTAGPIEVHEFAGKTDPQIARELLERVGVKGPVIDRGLPQLFRLYLQELEAMLPKDPVTILPGVEALLAALSDHDEAALGLVTGNVADGARLKLDSAGLYHHFRFGAYGSDAEERNRLPAVAMKRATETLGRPFPPDEVLIVGDTPRDVACGLAHGVRTVAVTTGRYDAPALEDAGAYKVVTDFRDTDALVDLLLG